MELSRNFTLEEMPCHAKASPADIAALKRTATNVLQPIRDHFGVPVVVTSWAWWKDGCVRRTGAHNGGGTVDFVVPGVSLQDVFRWGLDILPRDYVGRWIYEPAGPSQGEHIHVAPIADMVAAFGPQKADSAAYVLTGPDSFTPVPGWGGATGAADDPISIEGITVTVPGASSIAPWALGAVTVILGAALAAHHRKT